MTEKINMTAIFARCAGDRSVGIPPSEGKMAIETRYITGDYYSKENRDWLRKALQDIWMNLFDEPAGVYFGDECPECLNLKEECNCRCMECGKLAKEHPNPECQYGFTLP